jgi:lipopolysaccharide export system permease protein
LSIITSENSHFEDLPGGRYMVFENGERIQGYPGDYNYTIEKFKEYAVIIEEKAVSNSFNSRAVASQKLWESTTAKDVAELQNRLTLPLTILLFAFIAVPLSKISPRGGIYGSVMLGFLVYFSHGNFSGIAQSWVIKGSIPVWPGVFWANFSLFVVGLFLLANWYGVQWVALAETASDMCACQGGEALSLVTQLTREGWSLSGRAWPPYERHETPYRFVPGWSE